MKRGLSDYEYEIVNQILTIELCFDACKEVSINAGMGDHFNCYFFNLNISKGITSLQSLLDPTKTEISLKNYIKEHDTSISKRERGERRVDAVELDELAKLYRKPLDYFIS